MKKITYILLFLPLALSAQNLYTNAPERIYPVLEEFISENFHRQTPTFGKINSIDSIVVEDLGYHVEDPFIKKIYGLRILRGNIHTIKVDSSLLQNKRRFERTLKHELGHVFGLPHINDRTHFLEFMSATHLDLVNKYYADPEIWQRINDNYYKSLQQ